MGWVSGYTKRDGTYVQGHYRRAFRDAFTFRSAASASDTWATPPEKPSALVSLIRLASLVIVVGATLACLVGAFSAPVQPTTQPPPAIIEATRSMPAPARPSRPHHARSALVAVPSDLAAPAARASEVSAKPGDPPPERTPHHHRRHGR